MYNKYHLWYFNKIYEPIIYFNNINSRIENIKLTLIKGIEINKYIHYNNIRKGEKKSSTGRISRVFCLYNQMLRKICTKGLLNYKIKLLKIFKL